MTCNPPPAVSSTGSDVRVADTTDDSIDFTSLSKSSSVTAGRNPPAARKVVLSKKKRATRMFKWDSRPMMWANHSPLFNACCRTFATVSQHPDLPYEWPIGRS